MDLTTHSPKWPRNYFSYGSNVSRAQMEERGILWEDREFAVLLKYRLTFNKKSLRYPGFSVANIVPERGSQVEGVLYRLSSAEMRKLDNYEVGYSPVTVNVRAVESGQNEKALTYVASPEFVANDLRPPPEYIRLILEGARDVFSLGYLKKIELQASPVDGSGSS